MTGQILTNYKSKISAFNLIPASGGCFEVSINGELVYSKLKTGLFPDEKSILTILQEKLKK